MTSLSIARCILLIPGVLAVEGDKKFIYESSTSLAGRLIPILYMDKGCIEADP